MNKAIAAKPLLVFPRVSTERPTVKTTPRRKPTGPLIYRVEKGANVWPGRKAL